MLVTRHGYSITDSTAQDDIPEKPHHPTNYKFPKRTFGQKEAVSHDFQLAAVANYDFTSRLSTR